MNKLDLYETRYSTGKIYKLVNNVDDHIYIGSTCTSLSKRKHQHKLSSNQFPERKVYKHLSGLGWENIEIVLIEEYLVKIKWN